MDIIGLHKELNNNIELVELDKNNKEALEKVKILFNKLLECIKLVLIEKRERYYGYFFMNFIVEINCYKMFEAAVTIDTNPFTMIVNPLLLGKRQIKEIIYIICHEIEHLVLEHPADAAKLNPSGCPLTHKLVNYAADASVNDRLDYDINKLDMDIISSPFNRITSLYLCKEFNKNLNELESIYYYFNKLKEFDFKGNGGDSFDPDSEFIVVGYDYSSKEIITSKDVEKKKVYVIVTNDDDYQQIKTKIRDFFKEQINNIPDEVRGLFPGHQEEILSALMIKPKINWKNILKRYIGITPDKYRKTRTRINRRQPLRYDIPGKINNRVIKIVVAIDTSASVETKMLNKIFNEIFSIVKSFKYEITVIECDAEVQKVYKAKSLKDVELNVKGRGGTYFRPVIEYINEHKELHGSVLVYFTDGFGEVEIPKPKTLRNLWIILDDVNNLSLNNPYGEVLTLE